jgi:putative two-component system response regulator
MVDCIMPNPAACNAPGARVFVLDDEPANIEFLDHVLSTEGYTILASTDAGRSAERLDEIAPDLVILDLMMPGYDGFRFLERVREWLRPDDYLPVLVATGDVSSETRRRALAAGAADFLLKPVSPAEVRLRVRNLLHTRFLHSQLRGQNARLEERVAERTSALDGARQEMLNRLARAAEFRDDQTGQHTQRVGRLAARMAQVLRIRPDHVDLIRKAAPLHDVGKIGIPDSILLKAGRLTVEERTVMETHTDIGARILSGSDDPLLRLAEQIALTHHERWDGAGYPRGLQGKAIPLSGRIVMVADVFDSLTHVRPYKRAWTVREALAEIRAGAGGQFDPAVVEALLRVAPEARVLGGESNGAAPGPSTREQLELRLSALQAQEESIQRRIRDLRRSLGQDAEPTRVVA